MDVLTDTSVLGAIEIVIWCDERRDDGMLVRFRDAGAAVRSIRELVAKMQAGGIR